ncbi:Pvc16 family protein [Trinickia acidisoli]|uniref:Pvc16 family protein n=1 Tax=Trinickia acidisoli TaxID=2767482 RepID=UPI001A8F4768|nr:Pvc16 family protein [Trinickia acidisoli]
MIDTGDSALIIPSISEALRKFICENVPLLSEGGISFDSPADWDGAKQNSLLIYLYQTEVNPYLRNLPPTILAKESIDNQAPALMSVPAPLVVDLTYMMVAYGSSGENEQIIANGLINMLDTCGYIPDTYLTRGLKLSGNDALAVVPQTTSFHELRDLWAPFSQKSY